MVQTRRLRALCVAYPGCDTLDVALFGAVLARAGQRWNHRAFELVLAAPTTTESPSAEPFPLVPSARLAEIATAEVVFVPGGVGAEAAARDPILLDHLERLGEGALHVAAVGTGQRVLAIADLLEPAVLLGDEATRSEWLARRPELQVNTTSEWLSVGRLLLAASSLGSLNLWLHLVETTLGKGEADVIARGLGRRWRAPRVAIKG